MNAFSPSASIDERHRRAIDERRDEPRVAPSLAEARADRHNVTRHVEHPVDACRIEAVDSLAASSSASVMYSGPIAATTAWQLDGVATVTRPAPERKRADGRQVRRPRLAARSGDDEHAAEIALVALGRARRHELAHRAPRQQVDARAVEALEHLGGNADVGDDDVAGARFGRRKHERKLGRAERDGGIGFDRFADRIGGVGREAGRQIDRDDRDA